MRSPAKEIGPRAERAIARILDATRAVFLTRGYGGTTIDEIARVAGMSRASFYTYFPTKRDVLLALGMQSTQQSDADIAKLVAIPKPWTAASVGRWLDGHFALLDDLGAFAFGWTQAAHEDDALRVAGMKQHLESCRLMGAAFGPGDRDELQIRGLIVFSMLERAWDYCQLYKERIDQDAVRSELTQQLLALAKRVR